MRVLLIDGNNIFAICWFACAGMSSKQPSATKVISLCKQRLAGYKTDFCADKLYVCWDGARDAERLQLYPDYKKRDEKPANYYKVLAETRELVGRAPVFINIYDPNREADDLIGTIAKYYDSPRNAIIIVSSDKDMYQLISDNTVVIRPNEPKGQQLYDKTVFMQKFGFSPKLFVDYYCMVGDSSDNIPGAKGIGKKTAAELVKKYGSLDNILQAAPKEGKNGAKILEARQNVLLFKKLMTLKELPPLDWMVF
jgi:DNA polymerase I